MKTSPSEVAFKPHNGKQTEFLRNSSSWVFYGGARGGGKSLMLAWKAALTPRRWYYERNRKKITKEQANHLKKEGKTCQVKVERISLTTLIISHYSSEGHTHSLKETLNLNVISYTDSTELSGRKEASVIYFPAEPKSISYTVRTDGH